MKKTDLAYAAGIIDGDGCIYIDRFKDKKKKHGLYTYVLRVKVCQSDNQAVIWLSETFGGSWREYPYHKYKYSANKKPLFIWQINNMKAVELLKIIKPYMKIKIKQAETGIQYEDTLAPNTNKPMLSKYREHKELLAVKMRDLNQRREIA